MELIKEEAI